MPATPAINTITLAPDNYAEVIALLDAHEWVVSCLCAAWCDVCTDFRARFDGLALRHPGRLLLWIDIEDRADLVDEFDVENFPTLLIQRGDAIIFYGAVEPDEKSLHRLITSTTRDAAMPPVSATRHALRDKLAAVVRAGS